MRVLVSGGGGFIGSHLVERLLEEGHEVRVLDDFSTGKPENLAPFAGRFELHDGDIRDHAACARAVEGMEAVYHEAALGSVPRSVADPVTSHEVNVNGTLNLLEAARARRVGRFVFASSSSVYGNAPEKVKTELLPVRPLSPYAASKVAAESYVLAYNKSYSMATIALRYFNVFGPRQDPESMYAAVVPLFATALLEGRSPRIYGDGEQTRDFTFVANVIDANLRCLDAPAEACGRAYNVACGGSVSVLELFRAIRSHAGPDAAAVEPTFADPRAGDVRHSLASIDAAREALGYEPAVDVADGIRRTVESYAAIRDGEAHLS